MFSDAIAPSTAHAADERASHDAAAVNGHGSAHAAAAVRRSHAVHAAADAHWTRSFSAAAHAVHAAFRPDAAGATVSAVPAHF